MFMYKDGTLNIIDTSLNKMEMIKFGRSLINDQKADSVMFGDSYRHLVLTDLLEDLQETQ